MKKDYNEIVKNLRKEFLTSTGVKELGKYPIRSDMGVFDSLIKNVDFNKPILEVIASMQKCIDLQSVNNSTRSVYGDKTTLAGLLYSTSIVLGCSSLAHNTIYSLTPRKYKVLASILLASSNLATGVIGDYVLRSTCVLRRKLERSVGEDIYEAGRMLGQITHLYHPVYNDILEYINSSPRGYGILLAGLPGTGKSSFVNLLGNVHKVRTISAKELCTEMMQEVNREKSTLVIDDVDLLLADGRTGSAKERESVKILLDALDTVHRVILTTNHPKKLDAAITRAGRVDKQFTVNYLNKEDAKIVVALGLALVFGEQDSFVCYQSVSYAYKTVFLAMAERMGEVLDYLEKGGFLAEDNEEVIPADGSEDSNIKGGKKAPVQQSQSFDWDINVAGYYSPSKIVNSMPRFLHFLKKEDLKKRGDLKVDEVDIKEYLTGLKVLKESKVLTPPKLKILKAIERSLDKNIGGSKLLAILSLKDNTPSTIGGLSTLTRFVPSFFKRKVEDLQDELDEDDDEDDDFDEDLF